MSLYLVNLAEVTKVSTDRAGLAEHSLDEHEEVAELMSEIESTDDTAQVDVLLRRLISDVSDACARRREDLPAATPRYERGGARTIAERQIARTYPPTRRLREPLRRL